MVRIRRRGRIAVLQALFEADTVNHRPEIALQMRLEEIRLPEDGVSYSRSLLQGVLDRRVVIDALIQRTAPEWPIEQMAAIDRNILRMAVFEILYGGDTPPKVAVNEAVELAKLFGSDSSSRFVNGVLGTVLAANPAGQRGRVAQPPDSGRDAMPSEGASTEPIQATPDGSSHGLEERV